MYPIKSAQIVGRGGVRREPHEADADHDPGMKKDKKAQ